MAEQVKTKEQTRGEKHERIVLDEINVMVGGQGGDGTITVVTLLAEIFRSIGLNVYTARNVLSRIKGGHAAGIVRAHPDVRYSLNDLQVLVAFDEETVDIEREDLDSQGLIIYDNSSGELNPELVPPGVKIFNAPFARLSMRHLRRDLYKNSIAFAVTGRLLGLSDETMKSAMRRRFERKRGNVLDYNLNALQVGLETADQLGITAETSHFEIKSAAQQERLLLTGNEATGFGFLVGGGRFFAGYPITPSTEIMEWLGRWLPQFGGVVKQTEDELAAVNMALGAALAGVRAMTATSGPGFSLMQEGISQSGSAEIPLIIVDSQRSGPSTGMPTKVEQSDLQLMVFGGHGEFPRIVLTPGDPRDCFYLAAEACNLAEKYQLPVFIALDQALSQNLATVEVDALDLDKIKIDRGKRLSTELLQEMPVYKRYEKTEDGVSPYSLPSMEGGMSLITGNERSEFGLVTTDRQNRIDMVEKRQRKLETAMADLPQPKIWGNTDAKVGFIGVGCTFGPIQETIERLKEKGVESKYFQPLCIWPLQKDAIEGFVESCEAVFIVEQNYTGQLANLIKLACKKSHDEKITSLLRYDGSMFKSREIAQGVLQALGRGASR